ncbi:MAG: FtsB family cell division protein [Myxococcota bacterium]
MTRRRKLLWTAVGVAGALAVFSAADARGFRRYLRLQREIVALAESNRHTAAKNRAMVQEIESLRSDRRALERAAREELGFVRPGELVLTVE